MTEMLLVDGNKDIVVNVSRQFVAYLYSDTNVPISKDYFSFDKGYYYDYGLCIALCEFGLIRGGK